TTAADLPGFCVTVHDLQASYLDTGQPGSSTAHILYVSSVAAPPKPWTLRVNDPLRLSGANVYLLGHGYAPMLRFTDRYGTTFTATAPFLPIDGTIMSNCCLH